MREVVREEIRGLLDTRKRDLLSVITATESRIREELAPDPAGDSQVDYNHPADMLTGESDYEKDLTLVEHQRSELTLVVHALHRLEGDDFGTCGACGIDIAVGRLRALPYARHCVSCQAKAEKRLH